MSSLKIGDTGFLELKSLRLEIVINKEIKWGLFNWSKELAPVMVIRELAHRKELKVKPLSLIEQSFRRIDNNSTWILGLEFDEFECISKPTLSSVSLLQANIEGKIYVKESYVNKVIEESCVALFDINTMINYDINLKVDEVTKELYE